MLVFCNPILLLPLAGISHMILHSILYSTLCSILCIILCSILRSILGSILRSISEARGASFVCFNTFAATSWG